MLYKLFNKLRKQLFNVNKTLYFNYFPLGTLSSIPTLLRLFSLNMRVTGDVCILKSIFRIEKLQFLQLNPPSFIY